MNGEANSLRVGRYRDQVGFPDIVKEDTFIFCNFGKYFKLTPELYEVWMDILKAVPNSILWMLRYPHESPDDAIANLYAAAQKSDVDTKRIIFTPLFDFKDHLQLKSAADLYLSFLVISELVFIIMIYLDSTPYNSHTTLAEALWAGVPAISLPMESIVSRTGASMVCSIHFGQPNNSLS